MNRIAQFNEWVKENKDDVLVWGAAGLQMQLGVPFAAHNLEVVFPEFDEDPVIEIVSNVDALSYSSSDLIRIYLPPTDKLSFSRDANRLPFEPAIITDEDGKCTRIDWNETLEAYLSYQPFTIERLDGWSVKSIVEGIESYLMVKSNFKILPRLAYEPEDVSDQLQIEQFEQDEFLADVKEWFDALPENAIISWHSPNLTPEAPYSHSMVEIGIDGIDTWDWTWLLSTEAETPADANDPFMLYGRTDADVFYTLDEVSSELKSVMMYLANRDKYLLPPLSPPPFANPYCYQTKRNEKIAVYTAPAWSPHAVTAALKAWLKNTLGRTDIEVVWAWRAVQSIEHQELLINLNQEEQIRDHFIASGTWVTKTCADWYNNLSPRKRQETWKALEEYLDSLSNLTKLAF